MDSGEPPWGCGMPAMEEDLHALSSNDKHWFHAGQMFCPVDYSQVDGLLVLS